MSPVISPSEHQHSGIEWHSAETSRRSQTPKWKNVNMLGLLVVLSTLVVDSFDFLTVNI